MKVVKVVVGTLAGLFALAHCVYLPVLIARGEHPSAWMGSVAGICIGAAVSLLLFRSAFAKPKAGGRGPEGEDHTPPRATSRPRGRGR
jgi:hypothetical protein